MRKKRGALSLWVTLILVFTALLSVVGVTVLALYLMGRFDEVVVEPQDISFVRELQSGQGTFDETTGRLSVSSDFSLVLSSTTEEVTEKEVELSLNNGTAKDGYVSNGIIRVPQKVALGRAFNVVLEKDSVTNWVNGGVATLTAQSENVLLEKQSLSIAVDVPVRDFSVSVHGQNNLDVVVGSTFKLDLSYSPAGSKYQYSNMGAEKQHFFSTASKYITYHWETDTFTADSLSRADKDTVTVYSFANSYFQHQVLDQVRQNVGQDVVGADFTAAVIRYLSTNGISPSSSTYLTRTVDIKVVDVSVDKVQVVGGNMAGTQDRYFELTTQSGNGDGTLGVSILDSDNLPRNELVGNVGVEIINDSNFRFETAYDADGNSITSGAYAMKVVETTTASGEKSYQMDKVEFDSANYESFMPKTESGEDGATIKTTYYLLPNTTPKEYQDYYWLFYAANDTQKKMKVNFFFENENGDYENFFAFEGEQNTGKKSETTFTYTAAKHQEAAPAWKNSNSISMEVSYDEKGNVVRAEYALADDLQTLEGNIYQDVRYFLFVANNQGSAISLSSIFNVADSFVEYSTTYDYQPLKISGYETLSSYQLWEIEGSTLIAQAQLPTTSEVFVVVATIKTTPNGNIERDAHNNYKLVQLSFQNKRVYVDSTLSTKNMTPTFKFLDTSKAVSQNDVYYIPALNKDSEGNTQRVLEFSLTYTMSETATQDEIDKNVAKINEAISDRRLRVVCANEQGVISDESQYVTLNELTKQEGDTGVIKFTGTLVINESLFGAVENNNVVTDADVYLKLLYDNGVQPNPISLDVTGEGDIGNHFHIYYQMPVSPDSLSAAYKEQGYNRETPIVVQVSSIGSDGNVTLSWGEEFEDVTTLVDAVGKLRELLTYTLKDRFEQTISTQNETDLYQIRFEEAGSENLFVFNDTATEISGFRSTGGDTKTTTLNVKVLDSNGKQVQVRSGDALVDLMETFTFTVTTSGVYGIKKAGEENFIQTAGKNETGEITHEIDGNGGTQVNIKNLFEIYTSEEKKLETSEYIVQVSSSFARGLSSARSADLRKMLAVNDFDGSDMTDLTGQKDDGSFVDISSFSLAHTFGRNTTIEFTIMDKAGTAFSISLKLKIKKPINITNRFETEVAQYENYLVKKGDQTNVISLFADEQYELGKVLELSDKTWTEGLSSALVGDSIAASTNGVLVQEGLRSNEDTGLISIVKDASEKLMLKFDKVYTFTDLSFTLYYEVNNYYALNSGTIRLFLNPNILIEEQVAGDEVMPTLDLDKLGSETVATHYKFYRATTYIQHLTDESVSLEGATVDTSSFNYTNITGDADKKDGLKYINIDKNAYKVAQNGAVLELNLGDRFVQTFAISRTENDRSETVAAVRMKATGGTPVLCKNQSSATIDLNIGFGSNDAQTVESIFTDTVKTVKYKTTSENGDIIKTYLLIQADKRYFIDGSNGFSVATDAEGRDKIKGLAKGVDQSQGTYIYSDKNNAPLFNATANEVTMAKNVADADKNTFTVQITMPAIATRIGETFVYYLPKGEGVSGDAGEKKLEYNKFKDVDFNTLLTDPESAEVEQELQAGKAYTILHDTTSTAPAETYNGALNDQGEFDGYGIYYNKGLVESEPAISIETYQLVSGKKQSLQDVAYRGEEENSNKLYINHLAIQNANVYVVLNATFTRNELSYSFKYVIKVNEDVNAGGITYPFATDAEYLDALSPNFDGEKYTVDFTTEGAFNEHNSKETSRNHTRLSDPTMMNEGKWSEGLAAHYAIVSATENGVATENYTFDEKALESGKLVVTLSSEKQALTLVVRKSFTDGDFGIVGGSLDYVVKFNQGKTYVSQITQTGGQQEKNVDNIYNVSLKAGEQGAKEYTVELNERAGSNVETVVKSFNMIYDEQSVADISELSEGKFTIKPHDTIDKDTTFNIYFYTEQKVAFKFVVTVTGKYNIALNQTFEGGKKYNFFNGESSILKELGNGDSISDVDIVLVNGGEHLGGDENLPTLDKFVNIVSTKATSTSMAANIEWQNKTVEFAHLDRDVVFRFNLKITENGGDYTYPFEVTVKKSITIADEITVSGGELFGGKAKEVKMSDISTLPKLPEEGVGEYVFKGKTSNEPFTFTPTPVATLTPANQHMEVEYKFGGTTLYTYNIRYSYRTKPNAQVKYNFPAPDGETMLEAEHISTSRANENAAYKSGEFGNFLTTQAQYAIKTTSQAAENQSIGNRVEWKSLIDDETDIDTIWNVSVVNKNNVNLSVSGVVNLSIASETTNQVLLSNVRVLSERRWSSTKDGKTTAEDLGITQEQFEEAAKYSDYAEYVQGQLALNFTFTLAQSTSNGRVELDITINNVRASSGNYIIIVDAGSSISIKRNAPNYDISEEVYAEDLATYSNKALFAPDRILHFALKEAGTYYAKFEKAAEGTTSQKYLAVTSDTPGKIINVDVGESLTGYTYKYTVSGYSNGGMTEQGRQEDSIYVENELPTITSRIIATYGGAEIKTEGENEIKFARIDAQGSTADKVDASEVKLVAADLNKQATYKIYIGETDSGSIYTFELKLNFQITGNADSADNYLVQDIVAVGTTGETKSLLDDFDFGISTTRKQNGATQKYTADMMKASPANFDVKIYGFADVQVEYENTKILDTDSEETKLAKVAGAIHNKLIAEQHGTEAEYYTYHTGLTPRANMAINSGNVNDNNIYNYLVVSGEKEGGDKEYDYGILAQGCNNDGNHVMLKVTYSVTIDENETITQYHNILFRVVPNDVQAGAGNTRVEFKANHDTGTASSTTNYTKVFEGKHQSVANNMNNPYRIDSTTIPAADSGSFNLFTTNPQDTGIKSSVVKAFMYGSKESVADRFTYKYVEMAEPGYNNYGSLHQAFQKSSMWTYEDTVEGQSKTYIGKPQTIEGSGTMLQVDLAELSLGQKQFFIELENNYGYLARFYFRIESLINPSIKAMTPTTISEGAQVSVGSVYRMVSGGQTYDNNGAWTINYGTFTYSRLAVTSDSNVYRNTLRVYADKEINYTLTISLPQKVSITTTAQAKKDVDTFIITKKASPTADGQGKYATINIWEEGISTGTSGWTARLSTDGGATDPFNNYTIGKEQNFGQATLEGATITFALKSDPETAGKEDTSTGGIKVVYENNGENPSGDVLTTEVSVESRDIEPEFEQPAEEEEKDKKVNVTLQGIPAYAFNYNVTNVDLNSLTANGRDLASQVTNLKVKRIDYYYGNLWIGGDALLKDGEGVKHAAATTGGITSNVNENFGDKLVAGNLVTTGTVADDSGKVTKGVKFISDYNVDENKVTLTPGFADEEKNRYIVPHVDGWLFGTSGKLENVTMMITLYKPGDKTGNTCEVSRTVDITREVDKLFVDNNILDGERLKPSVDTSKILNNTLEVQMAPGEKTSFVIHNQKVLSVDPDNNIMTTYIPVDTEVTTTPVPSVDYYTYNKVYEKANNLAAFAPDTTYYQIGEMQANVINLENTTDYTYTEYVSITGSMASGVLNSKADLQDKKFFVFEFDHVGNPKFFYNEKEKNYTTSLGGIITRGEGAVTNVMARKGSINIATIMGSEGAKIYDQLRVTGLKVGQQTTFVLSTKEYKDEEILKGQLRGLNAVQVSMQREGQLVNIALNTQNINDITAEEIQAGKTIYIYQVGENYAAISESAQEAHVEYYVADEVTTISLTDVVKHDGFSAQKDISPLLAETALKMYLPSVKALTSDTKVVDLAFLYEDDGQIYQHIEKTVIHPRYSSAAAQQTQLDNIIVNDYWKVEKTGGEDTYFIVPFKSWTGTDGGDISLTPGWANTLTAESDLKLVQTSDRYMFNFATATGSAYIDEYGMLTTTQNFRVNDDRAVINLYMNVSGYDGKYQETNTELLLGTFYVRLQEKDFASTDSKDAGIYIETDSTVSGGDGRKHTVTVPQNYNLYGNDLNFDNIGTITSNPYKEKTFAYNAGDTLDFHEMFDYDDGNAWPSGVTNKRYHLVKIEFGENSTDIYCCNNIDFYQIREDGAYTLTFVLTGRDTDPKTFTTKVMIYATDRQNTKDILLSKTAAQAGYDVSELDAEAEDWWRLDDVETGKITKLNTYVQVDKSKGPEKGKKYYTCEGEEYTEADVSDKFDPETTYYEYVTERFDDVGIVTRMYLAKSSKWVGGEKVYTVTYYIYDKELPHKSVAKGMNVSFMLSNLVDKVEEGHAYEFYADTNGRYEKITSEAFLNRGAGSIIHANYILVEKDATGKEVAVNKQNVTYKIIGENVNVSRDVFVPFEHSNGTKTITKATIMQRIKQALSLQNIRFDANNDPLETETEETYQNTDRKFIMVQLRSDNGLLQNLDNITLPENATYLPAQTFLVTYRSEARGNIHLVRVSLSFYLHENAEAYQFAAQKEAANPFEMNKLDDDIRAFVAKELKLESLTGSVTYRVVGSNGSLNNVTEVPLSDSYQNTFYVQIGSESSARYFLIDISLIVAESVKDAISTLTVADVDQQTLDAVIRQELINNKIVVSTDAEVKYYKLNGSTYERIADLNAIKAHLSGEEKDIYISVANRWYKFNLTMVSTENPSENPTQNHLIGQSGVVNSNSVKNEIQQAISGGTLYYSANGKLEELSSYTLDVVNNKTLTIYANNGGWTRHEFALANNIESMELTMPKIGDSISAQYLNNFVFEGLPQDATLEYFTLNGNNLTEAETLTAGDVYVKYNGEFKKITLTTPEAEEIPYTSENVAFEEIILAENTEIQEQLGDGNWKFFVILDGRFVQVEAIQPAITDVVVYASNGSDWKKLTITFTGSDAAEVGEITIYAREATPINLADVSSVLIAAINAQNAETEGWENIPEDANVEWFVQNGNLLTAAATLLDEGTYYAKVNGVWYKAEITKTTAELGTEITEMKVAVNVAEGGEVDLTKLKEGGTWYVEQNNFFHEVTKVKISTDTTAEYYYLAGETFEHVIIEYVVFPINAEFVVENGTSTLEKTGVVNGLNSFILNQSEKLTDTELTYYTADEKGLLTANEDILVEDGTVQYVNAGGKWFKLAIKKLAEVTSESLYIVDYGFDHADADVSILLSDLNAALGFEEASVKYYNAANSLILPVAYLDITFGEQFTVYTYNESAWKKFDITILNGQALNHSQETLYWLKDETITSALKNYLNSKNPDTQIEEAGITIYTEDENCKLEKATEENWDGEKTIFVHAGDAWYKFNFNFVNVQSDGEIKENFFNTSAELDVRNLGEGQYFIKNGADNLGNQLIETERLTELTTGERTVYVNSADGWKKHVIQFVVAEPSEIVYKTKGTETVMLTELSGIVNQRSGQSGDVKYYTITGDANIGFFDEATEITEIGTAKTVKLITKVGESWFVYNVTFVNVTASENLYYEGAEVSAENLIKDIQNGNTDIKVYVLNGTGDAGELTELTAENATTETKVIYIYNGGAWTAKTVYWLTAEEGNTKKDVLLYATGASIDLKSYLPALNALFKDSLAGKEFTSVYIAANSGTGLLQEAPNSIQVNSNSVILYMILDGVEEAAPTLYKATVTFVLPSSTNLLAMQSSDSVAKTTLDKNLKKFFDNSYQQAGLTYYSVDDDNKLMTEITEALTTQGLKMQRIIGLASNSDEKIWQEFDVVFYKTETGTKVTVPVAQSAGTQTSTMDLQKLNHIVLSALGKTAAEGTTYGVVYYSKTGDNGVLQEITRQQKLSTKKEEKLTVYVRIDTITKDGRESSWYIINLILDQETSTAEMEQNPSEDLTLTLGEIKNAKFSDANSIEIYGNTSFDPYTELVFNKKDATSSKITRSYWVKVVKSEGFSWTKLTITVTFN